tara:strand:+ start:68 stop:448 length:381 start_codon:yes stop_codon:yes gene_type:complete
MLVDPTEGLRAFCSLECGEVFEELLRKNVNHISSVRLAELDVDTSFDFLISGISEIKVIRYTIPEDVAPYFKAHEPPVGLEFPIITIDYNDGVSKRIHGKEAVVTFLKSISSPYAMTRKFKTKKVK